MRLSNAFVSVALGTLLAFTTIPAAVADDDSKPVRRGDSIVLKASKQSRHHREQRSSPQKRSAQRASTGPSKYDRELAAWKVSDAAFREYLTILKGPNRCSAVGCPAAPTVVRPPGERPTPGLQAGVTPDGPAAPPPVPQISPQQAAYVAVARLRLTAPEPVIGPSPKINEWKIGAVGYPYWLWAEGELDPAPVSTTVEDLTVRLDARLQSTTFDLGDGTELSCTDLTARWTPAVEPGAASPACGHTYSKPSLPKGDYTITAYSTWVVDWSVNGVGGSIPLYQQASTTIPVGELQVLTH